MFNIIGTVMFSIICLVTPLVSFMEGLTNSPSLQIANMHTLFNISTTLVLLPFGQYLVKLAEKILGQDIAFEQIGGATDARLFAERGATVIMHSGTGEGMHGDNEYVELNSVEKLAEIQIEYLKQF